MTSFVGTAVGEDATADVVDNFTDDVVDDVVDDVFRSRKISTRKKNERRQQEKEDDDATMYRRNVSWKGRGKSRGYIQPEDDEDTDGSNEYMEEDDDEDDEELVLCKCCRFFPCASCCLYDLNVCRMCRVIWRKLIGGCIRFPIFFCLTIVGIFWGTAVFYVTFAIFCILFVNCAKFRSCVYYSSCWMMDFIQMMTMTLPVIYGNIHVLLYNNNTFVLTGTPLYLPVQEGDGGWPTNGTLSVGLVDNTTDMLVEKSWVGLRGPLVHG